MDLTMLFDYVLKWLIPFACAGLFAWIIKPLLEDFSRGRKVRTQQQWDECSSELKKEIICVQVESKEADSKLREDLQVLHKELSKEIQENTAGMRAAALAIHLRNLITDSKFYLDRGWISLEEWEEYNERYQTYIELGGNGHMQPWYPRVEKLKNKPPEK